ISLLSAEATLLQQFDHVEDGVAASQRQVLSLDLASVVDWHAHNGQEPFGCRETRIGEVRLARKHRCGELPPPCQALMDLEADHGRSAHLDRCDAHLPVALRKLPVA